MEGSTPEDTTGNCWKAAQREKTMSRQGTPLRWQPPPLCLCSQGEHRARSIGRSGRRAAKGYQRCKGQSRGDNDPTHRLHRPTAARERFLMNLKSSGWAAAAEGAALSLSSCEE